MWRREHIEPPPPELSSHEGHWLYKVATGQIKENIYGFEERGRVRQKGTVKCLRVRESVELQNAAMPALNRRDRVGRHGRAGMGQARAYEAR